MRTLKPLLNTLIMIALLAVGTAGCGSDGNDNRTDDAQDNATPDPLPILNESVEKLQQAESIEIEMELQGYPIEVTIGDIPLPDDTPVLFKYARGFLQAPDRMNMNVQFSLGNFSTTADVIALDENQYFRGDLLTANRWINADLMPGFSPAALMSPEIGIPFALASITSLQLIDRIRMRGMEVFQLTGLVNARDVHALTFGLIRNKEGQLAIEVYISVLDNRLAQITLIDPAPETAADEEPTTWEISVLTYDQPVTITAPGTERN